MARRTGRSGSVQLSGSTVGYVTDWTFDLQADEIEVTAMGDSSKQYLGGLVEGSGSVDCKFDPSSGQTNVLDLVEAGTQVELQLSDGTDILTGDTVTVLSANISASYNDSPTLTFGYRGFLSLSGA